LRSRKIVRDEYLGPLNPGQGMLVTIAWRAKTYRGAGGYFQATTFDALRYINENGLLALGDQCQGVV